MAGLKEKFQQNACPADLPVYDSGIDPNGIKLPFSKVLNASAAKADLVVIGDTNHFNPEIRGTLKEADNLQAVAKSGFTHIGVETSARMQHWVDKYNDGALTRPEFEGKIDMSLSVAQGNEDGAWTRQIGTMVEFSKQNDIKFEFVDPGNGNQYCDETLPESEQKSCDIKKWKDRFQDDKLAEHLDSNLKAGGKGLLIYGSAHFSVDNGTREGFSGSMVKIDIYKNRMEYEADKIGVHKENAENGLATNSVKPDLIYFKDTQTLHTTCTTDPSLKERLQNEVEQKSSAEHSYVPSSVSPAVRQQHASL